LEQPDEGNEFLEQAVFTDEANFHIQRESITVRMWGSEKPHLVLAHLDPVCQSTLPVSINLCHSNINDLFGGVL
jgi:hypothetical protein